MGQFVGCLSVRCVCVCIFYFFFLEKQGIKSCHNSISSGYSECICENMKICVSLNKMLTCASGTRYELKTHDDQCGSKLSTALTKRNVRGYR